MRSGPVAGCHGTFKGRDWTGLDSTLQRRRSPKHWFDSFLFELLPRPVEQHELAKSESVFNVYLSPVAMKTKQWSLSL